MLSPLTLHNAAADPVAEANTDFGFRLLHQLSSGSSHENVFFSPFSVSQALSLALNGAGGSTQGEISDTLGLQGLTLDQVNHGNGQLLPSLENPDPKVELSIANALWANKGVKLDPGFQERCRTFYGAHTTTLDFHSAGAADTINDWVKDNTHGKIDKLVEPGDLVLSPAVLTNAVYFHGQWSEQFDINDTQEGPFTLDGGSTKTVPFMSHTGGYSYLATPKFQAVGLPYGSGRVSLYVFLPESGTSVDSLVGALNAQSWKDQIGRMKQVRLEIELPRFKVGYKAELKAPLSALGMGPVFEQGANFQPMGLSRGFIGEVIHKAILEVNEEGTVAAAATGVVMRSLAIRRELVVRVDHPFFCAIQDKTTGTILFMGVIRDPE